MPAGKGGDDQALLAMKPSCCSKKLFDLHVDMKSSKYTLMRAGSSKPVFALITGTLMQWNLDAQT